MYIFMYIMYIRIIFILVMAAIKPHVRNIVESKYFVKKEFDLVFPSEYIEMMIFY